MSADDPNFEVLTVGELRRRYRLLGVVAEEAEFDEGEVPVALKHLIPLARVWGIGDDLLREDMREAADPEALKELKRAVRAVEDELDKWLLSPQALAKMSKAYVAFTNLVMVADEI